MGGGGGSSGAVSYPAHMITFHEEILGGGPTTSVTSAINSGMNANPFTGETAYDPDSTGRLSALLTGGDDLSTALNALILKSAYDPTTRLTTLLTAGDDLSTLLNSLMADTDGYGYVPAPDTEIDTLITDLIGRSTSADLVALEAKIDDLVDGILDESRINGAIIAHSDELRARRLTALDSIETEYTNSIDDLINQYEIEATLLNQEYEDLAEETEQRLETELIPQLEVGMRNIGAINSSSFAIGKSILIDSENRQVAKMNLDITRKIAKYNDDIAWKASRLDEALLREKANLEREVLADTNKFSADLRIKLLSDNAISMTQVLLQQIATKSSEAIKASQLREQARQFEGTEKLRQLQFIYDKSVNGLTALGQLILSMNQSAITAEANEVNQQLAMDSKVIDGLTSLGQLIVEMNRMAIVAEKEEVDQNLVIAEKDAVWDLELLQYGGNILASIGSASVNTGVKNPSRAASAIGGALTGFAAGGPAGGLLGLAGGLVS
jgi:hypothetical protein